MISRLSPADSSVKTSDEKLRKQSPRGIIKYDQVIQRLEAEFQEKIAKKSTPHILPKPLVTPRRSSLQFTRDQFRGLQSPSSHSIDKAEAVKSSRRSVGDIFGERLICRNPEQGQAGHRLLRAVREVGDQEKKVSEDLAPVIKSIKSEVSLVIRETEE